MPRPVTDPALLSALNDPTVGMLDESLPQPKI